jgi:hypothetical protein
MVPTPGANKPTQNVGAEKPEADPFGDIVAGVLADTLVPGASIAMDAANIAGDATTLTGPDAPSLVPGITEQEMEPDDRDPAD